MVAYEKAVVVDTIGHRQRTEGHVSEVLENRITGEVACDDGPAGNPQTIQACDHLGPAPCKRALEDDREAEPGALTGRTL